ncbi:MAG: hypothetical protein M3380_08535 [Chloroflexota bacterium]|nr:hypothetical protein [Chloroflexota bacterium]
MATLVRESPRVKAQPSHLRLGGWLLLAAPLIFIGSVVWSLIMHENVTVTADPATIADAVAAVAPHRLSWAGSWLLSCISILAFIGGLIVLSRRLLPTSARYLALVALICAAAAAVVWLFLVYLNIGLIADPAQLPPFVAEQQVSTVGALIGRPFQRLAGALWCLSAALAGLGLFTTRLLRRTGLIVGILNALVFAAIAFGPGFPPIVALILMIPLGIGLVRQREMVARPPVIA